MDRRHIKSLSLLVICTVTAALILQWRLGSGTEREQVRARYEQLRQAMRAGNTNAILMLFVPAERTRATDDIGRLQTFAHDLGMTSTITVDGTQAWICPRRELPFIPVLRVGHEIEMKRVANEWYLTGRISIW